MATGITYDTFDEGGYVTVAEYKDAPTAVDISNLVVGGNQVAQDAELARVILRASSYMNEYLNQNLLASSNVETQRTRITPDGFISLHPNNWPVISLSSFQYGSSPLSLTSLADCSQVWFEGQQIVIPLSMMSASSSGALGFGYPSAPRQRMFVKYEYVSGYPQTLCTGTAGASTLTVVDATGIMAGEHLNVNDGGNSEQVTVATNYVYGSTTVPLIAPLTASHSSVSCSGLPAVIKEACILITTAFIKMRGDQAMTMLQTTRPQANVGTEAIAGNALSLALDMVNKYRRVR